MKSAWGISIVAVMISAAAASAATYTVRKDGSGDYGVIQAALDAAAAGDTILIGPGEYLEHTSVRFPAWLHDIESYANVTVDDLTLIGAGSDQTFIGPVTYSGNYVTESPKGVTYLEGGDIRVADLCLRNTHSGVYMKGRLFMDRCVLYDNYINVNWGAVGSGGWIRTSQIDVVTPSDPIAIDIINGGGAADILVENCSVQQSEVLIDGVAGVYMHDCQIADGARGMMIYGHADVHVSNCALINMSAGGIELAIGGAAYCAIDDSEIAGGNVALASMGTGSRFEVTNSRLIGGTAAVLLLGANSGICTVGSSDFVKGSGPTARCHAWGSSTAHDLRNNYWGTTDEATIQSWIIDHNDDPNVGATVLYSPFAGQSLPTETKTWGDMKAQFR